MSSADLSNNADNSTTQSKKPSTARAFIPLLLAGLFMVTGICVLLFIGREKARIIGQTITDLDIHPLLNTDKPVNEETMKGKVVVLYFWSYKVKICHDTFAEFAKIQRKYKDDPKVFIVSISCHPKEDDTLDRIEFNSKKFISLNGGMGLEVYYDPVQYSQAELSKLLTSGGLIHPTTFVLDGDSRVVDVWRDPVSAATLERAIEKAKRSTSLSK